MESKRKLWSRNIEFLLSTLGYSVGFGNIWRFPYLCMENGGGAFLIPYIICIIICGVPMFLAEISIGQFLSLSASSIWNFSPIFKGLGWAMIGLSLLVSIYCNILMSWVVYYLGMSFTWNLPWGTCANEWNTPYCFQFTDLASNNSSWKTNFTSLKYSNSSRRMMSSVEEFYL